MKVNHPRTIVIPNSLAEAGERDLTMRVGGFKCGSDKHYSVNSLASLASSGGAEDDVRFLSRPQAAAFGMTRGLGMDGSRECNCD